MNSLVAKKFLRHRENAPKPIKGLGGQNRFLAQTRLEPRAAVLAFQCAEKNLMVEPTLARRHAEYGRP
jgi:hypothetical protein